jgi:hypothetical protein
MMTLPESADFNGRMVKPGDRVKCYFAKDPYTRKWYAGTVECFLPTRNHQPKLLYEMGKKSNQLEIIAPENKNGFITYDDYRCLLMYVRTDEMTDDREGSLFDGFGLCCNQLGPVIFEWEEEYEVRPKISEGIESEDLPF